ncbi:MAG: zinc ribbon domain-containing protein [Bacillota bacterium]|nr:zinc ribbon domain-containing protein [Bacillota bacterium]MDW7684702.1 zinc ribbon domain-containing protein [Bacillota bacterium]
MFCNHCGQANLTEYNYCHSCGVSLGKLAAGIQLIRTTSLYCGRCGVALAPWSQYCHTCGGSLAEMSELAATAEQVIEDKSQVSLKNLRVREVLATPVFLKQSFINAAIAVIIGFIIAWITGIVLNKVLLNTLPYELAMFSDFFALNPLSLFINSHGAAFFTKASVSAMGANMSATVSVRLGLAMLLLIPCAAFILSCKVTKAPAQNNDFSAKIYQALGVGIAYGLIVALLSKVLGGFISVPLDKMAGLMGMSEITDVLEFAGASGTLKSGFNFISVLLLTTFWGCFFSLITSFYAAIRFDFGKLVGFINADYEESVRASLSVVKYYLVAAVLVVFATVIWFISEGGMEFAGFGFLVVGTLLLLLNGVPLLLLFFQGAALQAINNLSGSSEGVLLSLVAGIRTPDEVLRPWYFFVALLIPLVCGFIGGLRVHKKSAAAPWKSAAAFTLTFVGVNILIILVGQISVFINFKNIAPLLGMMGENFPESLHMFFGFPMVKTVVTVGIINFLTSLGGAYYAASQQKR